MTQRRAPLEELKNIFPLDRIHTDPLYCGAVSRDASFYHLQPAAIVDVLDSIEMQQLLGLCGRASFPVTFRAAGTSLSGQAQGSGIIARISRGWKTIRYNPATTSVTLEPGVIVDAVNQTLKPYLRRIGPDPASSQSCMIGGVAANNSSGMCCGTSENTYQTLDSLKVLFPPRKTLQDSDIPFLDTGSVSSRNEFKILYPEIIDGLESIKSRVRSNSSLVERIQRKSLIKNTMGYPLRSFLDFEDPIDILAHLLIGSEGTLGFISEITYKTLPLLPYRASALLLCRDLETACHLSNTLRNSSVTAIELLDFASLQSVSREGFTHESLRNPPTGAAALLIELRSDSWSELNDQEDLIKKSLSGNPGILYFEFTQNPETLAHWWDLRKGLLPSIGKKRPAGSTLVIEDVAVDPSRLAQLVTELRVILIEQGYEDAVIYGHAKDGNIHFVFWQNFAEQTERNRYAKLMESLKNLVAHHHQGSLKAEHGVGRNMAPFLEDEWGNEAVAFMREIKNLMDPLGVLNPGVIFSSHPTSHLDSLKETPSVSAEIDSCIECGFCEEICPSRNLTLTPRQRIALARTTQLKEANSKGRSYAHLEYAMTETCAGDGLCATRCPVGIDTGEFLKKSRVRSGPARLIANTIHKHWGALVFLMRQFLRVWVPLSRSLIRIQHPISSLPYAAPKLPLPMHPSDGTRPSVLYLPSCINQVFGSQSSASDSVPLQVHTLSERSGVGLLIPKSAASLCCGLPFESKSLFETSSHAKERLIQELDRLDPKRELPILMDHSACAAHLKLKLSAHRKILDSSEWLLSLLESEPNGPAPLQVRQKLGPIMGHVPCGARKLGLESTFQKVLDFCSSAPRLTAGIGCCGFAGDKGFTTPELTKSSLQALSSQMKTEGCTRSYSSSATCEIGLTQVSGVPTHSLFHLVREATDEKCVHSKKSAKSFI